MAVINGIVTERYYAAAKQFRGIPVNLSKAQRAAKYPVAEIATLPNVHARFFGFTRDVALEQTLDDLNNGLKRLGAEPVGCRSLVLKYLDELLPAEQSRTLSTRKHCGGIKGR